ncbi:unnamed protein product [Nezara viridula]|uniref:Gustatory receptor n=1 Tax=Nezara viridula TaxID=85310 RepID=A0A9P0MW37_NEZVI|nr:unnamed protein product [Nezara viridula]
MSTGEVAKFINNILFWPKTLSVVPSGKMLRTNNKFYIFSIFHQLMITLIAISAFRYFTYIVTPIDIFRVILPVYIIFTCIILNAIKVSLQIYANQYKDIFSSLSEINLRLKRINPFSPPLYDTLETKAFEFFWVFSFLYASMLGSVSFFFGDHHIWRLSSFVHNTNINMAHFVLTIIECFVTVINIQLDYIKKNIYTKQKIFALEQCVSTYLKIYNTCLKIEKIFSPHLLLIMSLYFAMIIMHLHFLIMKFSDKHFHTRPLYHEYNVAITVLCAVDILQCARCFQMLHSNSEELNIALYEVLMKREGKELLKCRKLLASIYANRKISVSALEFFNVDYTMVQSMISSCTTFVVIMSQFETSI